MGDLNVIDQFLQTFTQYIDSGFGLLGPDVRFLTTILIGIDITLAGLWWAMDGDADILGRLIKKILYVGVFALILNNFHSFTNIIYQSFAGLGLHAGGGALSAADLLKPGKLAGTGFSAAQPLLVQASAMIGFPDIFGNFITVMILLVAWLLVVIAFFILAIQVFITILEFKLTSLAGFTLVPFVLWNKTSFLAERVLGAVISSGVKVMVLAVIIGIGSSFFGQFTAALQGQQPNLGQAMSLVLASLTLLGLGIFGPGIASGLVSGAPQLGAGAAVGTVGAAAGAAMLAGGAGLAAARAFGAVGGGLTAIRAGAAVGGGPGAPPGPSTPGGPGGGGPQGPGSNPGGPGGGAPGGGSGPRPGPSGGPYNPSSPGDIPPWARRLKAEQERRGHVQTVAQTIAHGERPGAGANPDLTIEED
ncbi:MAG: P-type conjugative transfer protein TrbL [Caulobacteraceae bacterium]|nr:P-type conjugative transfer protein TrbL [Caulobacteraceae bacterium]